MMFCKNCGSQVADNACFCPYCGQKIESPSIRQQEQAEQSVAQAEQPVAQTEQPAVQAEQPVAQPEQPIAQAEQPAQPQQQPYWQQAAPGAQNPYAQAQPPYGAMPAVPDSEVNSTKSLGLVALIVGIFVPLVGIICGAIGISKVKKLSPGANPQQAAQLSKNKKLCIAGIVVPIVLSVVMSILIGIISVIVARSSQEYLQDYSTNYDQYTQDQIDDIYEQYGFSVEE